MAFNKIKGQTMRGQCVIKNLSVQSTCDNVYEVVSLLLFVHINLFYKNEGGIKDIFIH